VQIDVDNVFATSEKKADRHVEIYDAAPEGTGEVCEGVEETVVYAHGHDADDAEEEDGLEDHLNEGGGVWVMRGYKKLFGKKGREMLEYVQMGSWLDWLVVD